MSSEALPNSRAPSLRGHYPASPLPRARPPPSRRRPLSRRNRLYGLPTSADFVAGRGGLLQLPDVSCAPCRRSHPAGGNSSRQPDCDHPCCLRARNKRSASGIICRGYPCVTHVTARPLAPILRWCRRWASELGFPAALPSKLRGLWLLPRWDCLPLNTSAFSGRTLRLLPSGAHAPRARQGRPRPQAHRTPRGGQDRAASRSRRPAPPLPPPGRVVPQRRQAITTSQPRTRPSWWVRRPLRTRPYPFADDSIAFRRREPSPPTLAALESFSRIAQREPKRRPTESDEVLAKDRHLRRILTTYLGYYHRARTHLSLDKDAPDGRPIEPAGHGTIITMPEVGGLHHRYVRRAS